MEGDAADVLAALRALEDKVGARPAEHRMPARPERYALARLAARAAAVFTRLEDSRGQRREPHEVSRGRADRRDIVALSHAPRRRRVPLLLREERLALSVVASPTQRTELQYADAAAAREQQKQPQEHSGLLADWRGLWRRC